MIISLRISVALGIATAAFGLDTLSTQAMPPKAALKVIVDIPELHQGGSLVFPRTLINQNPQAHFHVVIENISSEPVFLWDQGNSLGSQTLTFRIVDAHGQTVLVQLAYVSYTKNILRTERLAPGEVQVWDILYASRTLSAWEPFPFPKQTGATEVVTIQAIFQQDPSEGAKRWHVWTGRVVSKPCSVVLENAL